MEKLDPSRREVIKKMSSLRLSAKLLEAGIDEAQIQAMDRGQMMAAWAELVADGKELLRTNRLFQQLQGMILS